MITAALLLAAGLYVGREWITEKLRVLAESPAIQKVDGRTLVAAGLLVAALAAYSLERRGAGVEPTPAPPAPAGLSFKGLFIGPTAAADAAMLSGLCDEIASCLEVDGMKPQPRLTSGVSFDDLRIAAREGRMRGESLGARQPHVRDAIHKYLDQAVGTAGGPVSPDQRAKWVTAYRDLARAAADVTK